MFFAFYYIHHLYAVYDSNYDEMDIPNLYTDSPYQKLMDSHKDISFISMDEMDKIASDKIKEIGITDKIDYGKPLEYTEIYFDKEYVHDKSADRYRTTSTIQEELALIEERSEEYETAEILADLDGEDFVIPDAVAESYADVDIP